jgi:hypothetical protein
VLMTVCICDIRRFSVVLLLTIPISSGRHLWGRTVDSNDEQFRFPLCSEQCEKDFVSSANVKGSSHRLTSQPIG